MAVLCSLTVVRSGMLYKVNTVLSWRAWFVRRGKTPPSVATVPTLFDLVKKLKLKDHSLQKGDIIMFGSVGAGMNINAITYKI